MNRRGFLFGAGATLAVVRTPGLLMPVRPARAEPLWRVVSTAHEGDVLQVTVAIDPAALRGTSAVWRDMLTGVQHRSVAMLEAEATRAAAERVLRARLRRACVRSALAGEPAFGNYLPERAGA